MSDARLRNVHHGDPQTLGALFQAERWRGRDNLRVTFRRPWSWRSLPSALIPMVDTVMIVAAALGVLAAAAAPRLGLGLVLGPLTIIAAAAGLKVLRAMARERAVRGLAIVQLLLVMCVYDLGRALALVTPAPHRTRPTVVATS